VFGQRRPNHINNMPKVFSNRNKNITIFDKDDFMYGISKSKELGRGFPRLDGVDLFKDLGYIAAGFRPSHQLSATIDEPINYMALDNTNTDGDADSKLWCAGAKNLYKYNIDDATAIELIISGSGNYNKGIAVYRGKATAATRSGYCYVAKDSDIGRIWLGATDITTWDDNYMSTVPTGKAVLNDVDVPHPIKEVASDLFILDGRYVNRFTCDMAGANAVYTDKALDLEEGWIGISQDEYGEFLAIGAIKDPDVASGYAENDLRGQERSRLFFWDRTSESWDRDRSTDIDGRLIWIKNKKGVLYILLQHRKDFELAYFDGNTIQSIKRFNFLELDAQKDSVRVHYEAAKDVVGNQILFGLSGNSNVGTARGRVMSFGDYDGEMPLALQAPLWWTKNTEAPTHFYSLLAAEQGFYYLGVGNTGNNGLYRVPTSHETGTEVDYNIEAPVISYNGRDQVLDNIQVVLAKAIVSGDILNIYKKVDGGSSWGATWESLNFSKDGGISRKILPDPFNFNYLQLRLTQGVGDDVRIKQIIVESHDAEQPE